MEESTTICQWDWFLQALTLVGYIKVPNLLKQLEATDQGSDPALL